MGEIYMTVKGLKASPDELHYSETGRDMDFTLFTLRILIVRQTNRHAALLRLCLVHISKP